MEFFGHWWYLLLLLLVVLIIWGPGKLPDVGAGMGRAIREFRKASTEAASQFKENVVAEPAPPAASAAPPPSEEKAEPKTAG